MTRLPYPDEAPDDFTRKAQYIKVSPAWFGLLQSAIQWLEKRFAWEDMSDAEYDQILEWLEYIYEPANIAEGVILEVGTIIQSASDNTPAGFLPCDGAAVSRDTYAALFAEIGTKFGAGNGTTTFNIPDLRQKFVKGGTSGEIGNTGGLAAVTLALSQIPAHRHKIRGVSSATGFSTNLVNARFRDGTLNWGNANEPSSSFEMYANNLTEEGGGGSHENEPPYVNLMHYIKF